jgi:hypothetical protein
VRRELFQDRMSFSALKRLLGRTAKLYPRIFQRVREHLGTRGAFWWLAHLAAAAFSERSESRRPGKVEAPQEEAAREFALYARRYKNRDGAHDQSCPCAPSSPVRPGPSMLSHFHRRTREQ